MTGTDLLLLALAGGAVGLDGTSCLQVMVSRPLVAGTLAGTLLGDPATGGTVGALLELLQLVVLPVGGARFPESGPGAVVGAATAAAAGGPGALALGVAMGLLWSRAAGESVILFRRLNGRLVPDPTAGPVTAGAVVRAHLGAIALDFARAAGMVGAGAALGAWGVALGEPYWPLPEGQTAGLLLAAGVTGAGGALRLFGGWSARWPVFVAGLGTGLVAGIVL